MIYNLLVFTVACLNVTQGLLEHPLEGIFKSNRLSSGAVFLIDRSTILVTQFFYNNGQVKNLIRNHNKWFKGILRTNGNHVDLPFRNGHYSQLNENWYQWRNSYLKVPAESGNTVGNFSAIAIVNDKNQIKATVPITLADVANLPERDHNFIDKDGTVVFVYPKCCPQQMYYYNYHCVNSTRIDIDNTPRMPIHASNMTDFKTLFSRRPLEERNIKYMPYYLPIACAENLQVMILPTDNAILLSNSVLVIPDFPDTPLYCMDVLTDAADGNQIFRKNVWACDVSGEMGALSEANLSKTNMDNLT